MHITTKIHASMDLPWRNSLQAEMKITTKEVSSLCIMKRYCNIDTMSRILTLDDEG
jgi:hypothetical protein